MASSCPVAASSPAVADNFAERIDAGHMALRGQDSGARRRAGFRLDDAAGELAASAPSTPAGSSGACAPPRLDHHHHRRTVPLHRRRLRQHLGYDRPSTPCPEPVTHRITDTTGATQDVCDGHAIGARDRITGVTVEPIT